jgi:hypothetical protein
MKTQEEIEKLAQITYPKDSELDEYCGFIKGYNKCQEDMADKWFEYPKNIPPIHSENYLVFVDECIKIDLFRGDHNKFNYEIYTKNCNITHWKSLPNKPLNKQD